MLVYLFVVLETSSHRSGEANKPSSRHTNSVNKGISAQLCIYLVERGIPGLKKAMAEVELSKEGDLLLRPDCLKEKKIWLALSSARLYPKRHPVVSFMVGHMLCGIIYGIQW